MQVIESFKLSGKVAVVTGGAGLFGQQIVLALAEAGARTVMASRNIESLREYADELAREGLEVDCAKLDLSDSSSIDSFAKHIQDTYGGADILVNNAVLRCFKGWDDSSENFSQSMRVNVTGQFEMTRHFGEQMASRGAGSIINIGSIQAMVGPDLTLYEGTNINARPDYFVHKGALLQMTKTAAAFLGPKGVRVNMLSPGGFSNAESPGTFEQRYSQRTMLRRMAGNSDIKGAIVFLASDASRYVTAANLPVDAGYTAI